MLKKNFDIVFPYLQKNYPNADTELNWETPFQLTIAVIMSAQTTDKQVNKVTNKLFQYIQHPLDVLHMGEKEYNKKISSIWLHNSKSRNIYKLSQQLTTPLTTQQQEMLPPEEKKIYQNHWYVIPYNWKECIKLAGIGEKTAKVVLHVLYKQPLIAVDTHVHRVSNRLWIVKTERPDQTSKIIMKKIPNHYHVIEHHWLILFGRYHCKAIKPACTQWPDACPFSDICKHYKKIKKINEKKEKDKKKE